MVTKEKTKYLKDKVASIIFTDEDTREYVECIVSSALNIPLEIVKDNLTLLTPRVNSNINVQYSEVDAIYENNTSIINIEINYRNYIGLDVKNMKYVCHLMLKQTKINDKYPKLKPIYQININNFDVFNENKFIYRSYIMEETIHKKRNDFISIIDINVDFLNNIDYNKIMEEEEYSLERMLYIFVCDNERLLDKLYLENEIMEKVREKISALTEDFLDDLYYDKEEIINEYSFLEGEKKAKKDIALSMIKEKLPIETISKITGLSIEEVNILSK